MRVIDGKARLVGDLLCDGLGACLKSCPEDAISVIEREAEPYDEVRVLENIIPQGRNVLEAHLEHLRSHGQSEYLEQALSYLSKHRIAVSAPREISSCQSPAGGGCPGSRSQAFVAPQVQAEDGSTRPSQLTHWPIQMHLISPAAPHFRNSDLVIAADCVAFSLGDFHKDYLKGRTLTIACPKLDQGQEAYQDKITALIDQAEVKSIDVMIMQVPCCSGLLRHVVEAAGRAKRRIPVRCVVVGLRGEILREMPVPIDQPSQPKALSLV